MTSNVNMTALMALVVTLVAEACGGHSGWLSGEQVGGSRNAASTEAGAGSGTGAGSGPLTFGNGSGSQTFGGAGNSGASASSGSGATGGCDASCFTAGGTCASSVCTILENPGNVAAPMQTTLQHTGAADPGFTWLYPYDKTVFPRGLLAPTLQFGGGASDAEYVHITSKTLDYNGYFGGGPADQVIVKLSQKTWVAVTAGVGAGDSAHIEVTKIFGGSVTGPIGESWPIAQGNIRGTVFYETYGSTIAGGPSSVGIMKMQAGVAQPTALKTGCGNVCHVASADGSTLVASTVFDGPSASYDVRTGISTITTAKDSTFTYMGLFPDGTFGMSATSYHFATTTASKLYSTKTAANIPAPGWDGVITLGGTPAFSPDGKQIAFMHEDKDARTISKMDFDVSTKTFSGLVDLASEPSGHVAWPAFTPDGKSVLFQSGSSAFFDTDCQNTGDLYSVDIATHTMRRLDVLDGYTGSGTASYLPAMDPGLNYAPTLLAEAVGGYFWTVFTSHRSYGSMLASKANSVGTVVSGCPSMPNEANGKLWVAAIDIDGKPGQDASHPAFYLDGQELEADNLRGYWVLPACRANATSCQTGDECCCGFCRSPATGSPPVCGCKPKGCSNEFETCTTAADCCMSSDQCINGRCATSIR